MTAALAGEAEAANGLGAGVVIGGAAFIVLRVCWFDWARAWKLMEDGDATLD